MHDRTRSSKSKQVRINETSGIDKSILHEGLCPVSIQSETVIIENVSSKNQSKSVEGMSDDCTTKIIAETMSSMADMVVECDVEKHSSLVDNVVCNASVPSKSLDYSIVKRNKSVSIDPNISVVNNSPPAVPRVKNFDDLPSPLASYTYV